MSNEPPLVADADTIHTWFGHVVADRPGFLSVCSDADGWAGRRFTTDHPGITEAVDYVLRLDKRRPKGIYAQVTTLREKPTEGRGGEDLAHALTHLWADGDFGTIGHKPGPDDLPSPPDAEAVARVVASSGLPEPSGWTHSGGGYNPIWMLTETHVLGDDEDRARIKNLTSTWQTALAATAYLGGWSWDGEVGNLDRLMKVPGTVNRKEGLERPTGIGPGNGALYDLGELIRVADELGPDARNLMAQAATERQKRKQERLGIKALPSRPATPRAAHAHSGDGPLDVLADTLRFGDVLEPAGFTYRGQHSDGRERWLRPAVSGDSASSEYSLLCNDHVAINWSERADLPVGAQTSGNKLTVGTLYAHLNYGGDVSAAAKDVMRAAAGRSTSGPAVQLPPTVLAEVKRRCMPLEAVPEPRRPDEDIDWGDLAEPPEPEPEGETPTERFPGRLPEEFYAARAELRQIRQAGHSRNRSGDVAFMAVLIRLSGIVSHHIRADTGVAGAASLNLFGGIIGPSGVGKSSGWMTAHDLMPAPESLDFRDGLPIGSGEGMAEIFMDMVEKETGELKRNGDPVMKSVRAQVRHNAFFYVDEGATLTRLMKERSGSTLGETLRSAAVGQTLGQTNASKETSRYIPSGSYSMGLLVGFQPETVAPLFEEVAEGTPQRFLWTQVIDPSIPDEQPAWPGELREWRKVVQAINPTPISFAQDIKDELRREDLAKARGEVSVADLNPFDAHAPLMRVKVASLLAILSGRLSVNREDWTLAKMVWDASCAVRDHVIAYSERQRQLGQEKRTQARIIEEVRVEQAKVSAEDARAEKAVARIAIRIAVLVRDNGPLSRSAIREKFAGRDKKHMADALAYALLREWVREEDGKLGPGPVPPA